jgi:predicted RNase H-like HicB family nuclease
MKYVYPAIFTPEEGNILASVPDLPGLHTFGNSMADALFMVQDAIEMWLWDAENNGEPIPPASSQKRVAKMCESPDVERVSTCCSMNDCTKNHTVYTKRYM